MSHNNPVNDGFADLTYDRRQTNWSIVLSNGTTTFLEYWCNISTTPVTRYLTTKYRFIEDDRQWQGYHVLQLLKNAMTELEWTCCRVLFQICDSFYNINRFNIRQPFDLHIKCKLAVGLNKCDNIRKVLNRNCMGKVHRKAAECCSVKGP